MVLRVVVSNQLVTKQTFLYLGPALDKTGPSKISFEGGPPYFVCVFLYTYTDKKPEKPPKVVRKRIILFFKIIAVT